MDTCRFDGCQEPAAHYSWGWYDDRMIGFRGWVKFEYCEVHFEKLRPAFEYAVRNGAGSIDGPPPAQPPAF